MASDINNYLTTLHIPQLNNDFAQGFTEWAQGVNENFAKIVSAPFLKGDKGNSIESESVYVGNDEDHTDFNKYELRAALISKINEIYKGDCTDDPIGDSTINSADFLNDNPVTVFVDTISGRIYIAGSYTFIDARLKDLKPNQYVAGFVDKTVSFTGVGEPNESNEGVYTWTLETHQIIPTMYYNEDLKQWCWCVNGKPTGISATGVKGEPGRDARPFAMVKGRIETGTVYIDYVYDIEIGQWMPPDDYLKDGDMVLCIIIGMQGFEGLSYGVAYKSSNDWWMDYDSEYDILKTIKGMKLIDMLDNINVLSNSDSNPRGLYIPSANPVNPDSVHMMWDDNNGKLNVGLVQGYQRFQGSSPSSIADQIMEVYYNTTVHGWFIVDGNINAAQGSFGDDVVMYENLDVWGGAKVRKNLDVQGVISTQGVSVQGDASVHKNLDVQGVISTQGISVQGAITKQNSETDSDLGLTAVVNLEFNIDGYQTQYVQDSSSNKYCNKYPTGTLVANVTLGYLGYANQGFGTSGDPIVNWDKPNLYGAKTFKIYERIHLDRNAQGVIDNTQGSIARILNYFGSDYNITINWTYSDGDESGDYSTQESFSRPGSIVVFNGTVYYRNLKLQSNARLAQSPLNSAILLSNRKDIQTTNWWICEGDLQITNIRQPLYPQVYESYCVPLKFNTDNFASILKKEPTWQGGYHIITPDNWKINKLFSHNNDEIVDFNMNVYCDVFNTVTKVMNPEYTYISTQSSFQTGITNYRINNMKIFPYGYAGYNTSCQSVDNLGFDRKYYNGAMICNMSHYYIQGVQGFQSSSSPDDPVQSEGGINIDPSNPTGGEVHTG